ncbi:MAG TPA: tyrosine-type recombinase/integrase [Acidimicrobiales bacterium]|nr:tyrosine-type recombinase/integrase [Acidimicrobiales bacterium]
MLHCGSDPVEHLGQFRVARCDVCPSGLGQGHHAAIGVGVGDRWRRLAASWLAGNPSKRGSGMARDESIVRNHLLPVLGDRRLGSIAPRDVQVLVASWDGQAARTVRRQYGVLTAILNYAVASDLIARSPARGVRLPEPTQDKRRHIVDASELASLAEALGVRYAAMAYLGAVLGLRWAECAGLRVRSLDFLGRTITVSEQRTRGVGGRMVEGPPKSEAGRRTLSVPPELMEVLAEHLRRRAVTAADPDAYVFVGPQGGPLEYSGFRQRTWAPACRKIGLPDLGFHDLRRANATVLVRSGVDVKTAQTRLGHSDPRLTLGIYAQASTRADRDAAGRLAAELMPSASEPDSNAAQHWP